METCRFRPLVANALFWRRRLLYTFTPATRFLSYFINMKVEELKFGAKAKVVKTLDGLSDKRRSSFIGQIGVIVGFFALDNAIDKKTRFSVSLRFDNSLGIEEFDMCELELDAGPDALIKAIAELGGIEQNNKVFVDVAGKGDTTTISNALEIVQTQPWLASGAIQPIGIAAQPIKPGESGFVKLFGTFAEETDPEKLKKMSDQFGYAGAVGIDGFGNPIVIPPKRPQKNKPGELGERKVEA